MQVPLIGAIALLLGSASAVFADEAWNLDYHYALLGLPKEDATFFHHPNPGSKASLIYTLSHQGVLGAVNPRDGAVVWRHVSRDNVTGSTAGLLRGGQGQDIVVSAIDGEVAAWSAIDGRLSWIQNVAGNVEDLEILELSDAQQTLGAKDAIVLTSGEQAAISRLDGTSGSVKWSHPIESGDIPYQVSASSTEVYAIVLHKTLLGNIKIKVISLDPVTGRKTNEYSLSSDSELSSTDLILSVGANSASPIIAWTDNTYTVLKVNIIGTKSIASFEIEHGEDSVTKIRLHAPSHASALAHFLVHYETASSHWAEVFHIDPRKNKIARAYTLPKLSGKGAFSTSTSDANVYFTRITKDRILTVASSSHGVLGQWPLQNVNFGIAAPKGESIEPLHVVSEVSVKGDSVSALRSAVLLSSGDWVMIREGTPLWQRPEVLATTVMATFATPAEVETFRRELEIEAYSNPIAAYLHRVKRHIQDLQRLPEVFSALPVRLRSSLFGTTAESTLTGDVFGFHQVIACATENGRVVALDAANPSKILWTRAVHVGLWKPVLKSHSDGILVFAFSDTEQEIRLNATNGEDVPVSTPATSGSTTAESILFTMRNGQLEAIKAGSASAGPLWHFTPADQERVVSLVPRPVNDPVASIGKVLGDRRVLYKYLTPNLALLVTANDAAKTLYVYVLDTVSGATIFSNTHSGVDLFAPISSVLSENWFAYSFTSESAAEAPKGHHLVVGEMFESLVPNDRGPLTGRTNTSSLESAAEPFVLLRSYQIPEAISKLAVTQTRQGITSRQLLAVLTASKAIVGIPYGVVDPRRPIGRDPTKDEQMEGLAKYTPTIEFDPKWYISHKREVLGIRDIVTSPALIESTSLVFGYGLDIFGTRLSPSFSFDILGKDFNKFQMLATVAALAVATFVVAPLVARKQVNARWQFA